MKRATQLRRWTDDRLAGELVKAARRAAALAEEVNRRARIIVGAELAASKSAEAQKAFREQAGAAS